MHLCTSFDRALPGMRHSAPLPRSLRKLSEEPQLTLWNWFGPQGVGANINASETEVQVGKNHGEY